MKKKIFISTISALILVLSLTTALCACNTTNSEVGANNLVLEQTATEGLELSFGEATVASDGTTSQTITASIVPDDAFDTTVVWSIAWATTNSENISNYLTLSTNGNTATITCLQPFSTQAEIKATSSVNSDIYATATVDYTKKLTNASIVNFYNATGQTGHDLIVLYGGFITLYDIGDCSYETHGDLKMMIDLSYTYSVGTLPCTTKVSYVSAKLTEDALQWASRCYLTYDADSLVLTGNFEDGYYIGSVLQDLIEDFDLSNSSIANFCFGMVDDPILEITVHFDNGLECSGTLDFHIADDAIVAPRSVALSAFEMVF